MSIYLYMYQNEDTKSLTDVFGGANVIQKQTPNKCLLNIQGAEVTAEQEVRLKELYSKDASERVGTARGEILDSIRNDGDPYGLAKHFEEMTPMELALGKLYGALMAAKGNVQVDNAFIVWEANHQDLLENGPLTDFQKNMILVSTIQQIVGANPDGIRVLRKVLVTLNTK